MEREIQTNSIERLNTAISYAALVLGLLNSNQFNTWRQMHTTGMNAEVSQNRKNFDAALQSYTLHCKKGYSDINRRLSSQSEWLSSGIICTDKWIALINLSNRKDSEKE